jgi:hypothetical protein
MKDYAVFYDEGAGLVQLSNWITKNHAVRLVKDNTWHGGCGKQSILMRVDIKEETA